MQLNILAIGKARTAPEHLLAVKWMSRLPCKGALYVFDSPLPTGPMRIKDESTRMQQWLDKHGRTPSRLICLDGRGEDMASEGLARLIGTWRDQGVAACYFAIGGADGHGDILREQADKLIAFGRATWPHLLCRAMLAEQLYRAQMILTAHPYHRA